MSGRHQPEQGADSPGALRSRTDAIFAEHRRCDTQDYDGCYAHWNATDHCRADGTTWPCDVERLREAAAAPEPPRADPIHQIGPGYCKTCEPGFGHNHPDYDWGESS